MSADRDATDSEMTCDMHGCTQDAAKPGSTCDGERGDSASGGSSCDIHAGAGAGSGDCTGGGLCARCDGRGADVHSPSAPTGGNAPANSTSAEPSCEGSCVQGPSVAHVAAEEITEAVELGSSKVEDSARPSCNCGCDETVTSSEGASGI